MKPLKKKLLEPHREATSVEIRKRFKKGFNHTMLKAMKKMVIINPPYWIRVVLPSSAELAASLMTLLNVCLLLTDSQLK